MKTITFRRDVLPLKDMLFRMALHIVLVREDAEDIVQETLLKVWSKRDSWDSIESMEAWCITICRNLALDHVRRKHSLLDVSSSKVEHSLPDDSRSPLEEAHHNSRVEVVKQLIGTLTEKQRTCMMLRDIEGKSYKEIADVLDMTIEQVKINIFRGRQAVRNKYQKIDNDGL